MRRKLKGPIIIRTNNKEFYSTTVLAALANYCLRQVTKIQPFFSCKDYRDLLGKNVLIKSTLDIYKLDFSTMFFDSSVMAGVRDFK